MITEDTTAVRRIEEAIRERVPPTPTNLRTTILSRIEDHPTEGSPGAADHRLPIVLVASGLLAAAIVVARVVRAAALGRRTADAVRRAARAPRSAAGAASR